MLRWTLLIIGVILIVAGMVFRSGSGFIPWLQFLIVGMVLVLAILGERWRYQRKQQHERGMWQRTGECFEDPETGVVMEVLYNPHSGERRYEPRDKDPESI